MNLIIDLYYNGRVIDSHQVPGTKIRPAGYRAKIDISKTINDQITLAFQNKRKPPTKRKAR